MRKIGYCRVSLTHQNLDRQLGALSAERVDVIFREKASGRSVKGLNSRRPSTSSAPAMSSSSPNGTALPGQCSTASTRQRIVKRANDGRKFARANGVQFGRMPKLSAHQRTEALRRLDAGESCRSIAKTMGVHHQTISKLAG